MLAFSAQLIQSPLLYTLTATDEYAHHSVHVTRLHRHRSR